MRTIYYMIHILVKCLVLFVPKYVFHRHSQCHIASDKSQPPVILISNKLIHLKTLNYINTLLVDLI